MKKISDLMAELGFRADAPDSVKRAFIENLVRAADRSAPPPANPRKNEQLAFDFSDENIPTKTSELKRPAG